MSVEIKRSNSLKTIFGTISVTHYLNTTCAPYKVGKENAYPIYFWLTMRRTTIYRRSIIITPDYCTPSEFYSRDMVAEIDREQKFIFDVLTQYLADDKAHHADANISVMKSNYLISPLETSNKVRAQVGGYLDYFTTPLTEYLGQNPYLVTAIMRGIYGYLYNGYSGESFPTFDRADPDKNTFNIGGLYLQYPLLPPIDSAEFKHLARRFAPDSLQCYELAALLDKVKPEYTTADIVITSRRVAMWRALIKTNGDQLAAIICDDSPTPAKLETIFAAPLRYMLTMGDELYFEPIK